MIKIGKFGFSLKKSILGLIAFGLYFGAGLVALGWHLYSVSTNVGDSGLSALYLYFLSRPWINFIPDSITYSDWWGMVVYPVAMLFVFINGFFLYILFGGLKITRGKVG